MEKQMQFEQDTETESEGRTSFGDVTTIDQVPYHVAWVLAPAIRKVFLDGLSSLSRRVLNRLDLLLAFYLDLIVGLNSDRRSRDALEGVQPDPNYT